MNAMSRRRLAPIAVACLLLPLAATAQAPREVTLRVQPKANETFRYNMTVRSATTGGGMNMNSTLSNTTTYRVTSSRNNRTTFEITTSNTRLTMPGMQQAESMARQMDGQKITQTVDQFGKVIEANSGQQNAMLQQALSGNSANIEFPRNPVRVGTTWRGEIDMGAAMSAGMGGRATGKLPVNYRVTKIETVRGRTLVTIEQTIKGTTTMQGMGGQAGNMTMTTDGRTTIVVDAATGMQESVVGKTTMDLRAGQMNMRTTIDLTMRRA